MLISSRNRVFAGPTIISPAESQYLSLITFLGHVAQSNTTLASLRTCQGEMITSDTVAAEFCQARRRTCGDALLLAAADAPDHVVAHLCVRAHLHGILVRNADTDFLPEMLFEHLA